MGTGALHAASSDVATPPKANRITFRRLTAKRVDMRGSGRRGGAYQSLLRGLREAVEAGHVRVQHLVKVGLTQA
jgi:hypothetical protein